MAGLLDSMNNNGGWQSLLGLGAGLASKSNQGWGAGIGSGLGLAATLTQQQRNEALRQQQLQATLQHQQIMENLGLLNAQTSQQNAASSAMNAQTSAETRKDAIAVREQDARRREAELAGPVSLIAGGAPRYQQAKQDLMDASTSGRVWGSLTGGGKSGQALNTIKSMIMGAAKINGVKPEDLYGTMLPTSFEDAGAKLQNFEAYIQNTQNLVQGYPTLEPQISKFQPIFTPQTPPSDPATTTTVPMGGAPQQPTQAGTADPRGAYFGGGMNRAQSPEGTRITNGQQTLEKRNGQWVPVQ